MTKILLIDDSEDLRLVVEELLEDMGLECQTAGDVSTAMQVLDESPIDVVLCDLVLPVEDGTEEDREEGEPENTSAMVGVHAIHNISQKFPSLPVVAISGALVGGPLESMKRFGALTTLSKPFGRDELQAVIEFALRGNQPHA